jgi:hypothetical protein
MELDAIELTDIYTTSALSRKQPPKEMATSHIKPTRSSDKGQPRA